MQKIAIIDNATQKVVNTSEGDELPVAADNDSEDRTEFLEAHTFVFSETARIGDGFDGDEIVPAEPEEEELDIPAQIRALESQQTPRRLREAVLGIDDGWLENLEAEIAALRDQL